MRNPRRLISLITTELVHKDYLLCKFSTNQSFVWKFQRKIKIFINFLNPWET